MYSTLNHHFDSQHEARSKWLHISSLQGWCAEQGQRLSVTACHFQQDEASLLLHADTCVLNLHVFTQYSALLLEIKADWLGWTDDYSRLGWSQSQPFFSLVFPHSRSTLEGGLEVSIGLPEVQFTVADKQNTWAVEHWFKTLQCTFCTLLELFAAPEQVLHTAREHFFFSILQSCLLTLAAEEVCIIHICSIMVMILLANKFFFLCTNADCRDDVFGATK